MSSFTLLPTVTAGALVTVDTYADLPSDPQIGWIRYVIDTDTTYIYDGATWDAGSGTVIGPVTSTNNALPRFSGTTGATLKDSGVIVDDSNNVSGVGTLGLSGPITDASLTASRAVVTNGSKALTSSATSSTEIGYVAGVTSAIQTQLDTKVAGPASATDNAIARFDTTTGKVVQNSVVIIADTTGNTTGVGTLGLSGPITDASLTVSRALVSDGAKAIVAATTTATEIGYVNGVTSAIQTQLNAKQTSGNYITGLTGDVTASGPGSVAATVASVAGSSAANVHAAELLANAATNLNTASAIVKRDGSGNFTAGTITAALSGNASTVTTNANLTGDVTSVGNATTLTNAPVIAKVLTGYTSGAGTVSATDSILQAIQKLNGNDATNANLTGPVTSVGNATAIADGALALAKLATTTAGFIPVGAVTTGIPTYVAVSGDVTLSSTGVVAIGTGKVTSTMILDGTIVDADINASAAISISKVNFDPTAMSDVQATRMGFKIYTPGVTYAAAFNALTGTNSFNPGDAFFFPYMTQDGNWRMRFNITGTITTGLTTVVTVPGVTFVNLAGTNTGQAISAAFNNGTAVGWANDNAGTLSATTSSASAAIGLSGDVQLASKPTWAF